MEISEMSIADYDEVVSLWQDAEGIGLHDDCDSRAGIANYLQRNPGLSFVAQENDRLIGAVLCGHDGRRGYLHHLAVAETHRAKGIGRQLVEQSLLSLAAIGITKCHVFVFADNAPGQAFWQRLGWIARTDLRIMSKNTDREH